MQNNRPVYPISIAAEFLEVHPRTLRLYEKYGLILPSRRAKKRFFSDNDLHWIQCIREMIHQKGLNISGIKRLLDLIPCWEIKECNKEEIEKCSAYHSKAEPCWKLAKKICQEDFFACKGCKIYTEQKKDTEKNHQPLKI